MSDYLNNLVARTLNLAPVVLPRLPSLFEPSTIPAEVGDAFETETMREDLSSHEPALRVSRSFYSPNELTGTPPRVTAKRDQPVQAEEDTPAVAPASQLAAPVTTPLGRPESNSAQVRLPSRPAGARADSTALSSIKTEFRESRIQIQPITRQIVPEPSAESSAGLSSASFRELRDKFPQVPTQTLIARTTTPVEQPPSISVTIGRVDVRAIFPQTAAPGVNRHRPAAMSLDEYRKRRNEGRR